MSSLASEFLLLADTYYARRAYADAKSLYHLLLTNVRECLVQLDIWLKYGHCCAHLHHVEDAINSYRNAVNLDSANCEAALALVNMLKKNATLYTEAAHVIQNTLRHSKRKPLSIQILNLMINECFIQYESADYDTFLANARQLLFSNYQFVLSGESTNALLRVESKTQRAIVFHQMLEENNYQIEFNYNKLSMGVQNAIFDIYLRVCRALVHLRRYDELLTYAVGATVLPLIFEVCYYFMCFLFLCCLFIYFLKNIYK